MSEQLAEKSEEAIFANRFKKFVRSHLDELIEGKNRNGGTWALKAGTQLTPTPVNYVKFETEDLEVFEGDPAELIAEDGLPKQEMSITVGYRDSGFTGAVDKLNLYKIMFYERALDNPEGDAAFEIQYRDRDYTSAGVDYRKVEHLLNQLDELDHAGRMTRERPTRLGLVGGEKLPILSLLEYDPVESRGVC